MNRIYLDQASTSFPKAPGVAQAMMDYLTMNGVECEPRLSIPVLTLLRK